MTLFAIVVVGVVVVVWLVVRARQKRVQAELDRHSIDPEGLHALLTENAGVLLFDVRQPLDLLAYSERIPGAIRLAPKEVMANPTLIPKEMDAVVYCTCPSDKSSRAVLQRVQELQFTRVKFLRGGLEGWKAKGFAVEPYRESFHLDTAG
jgi:rhodanese-related sulfurtransferase